MGVKFLSPWSFILVGEGDRRQRVSVYNVRCCQKQNKAGGSAGGIGWVCMKDVHQKGALCILSQRMNMEDAG